MKPVFHILFSFITFIGSFQNSLVIVDYQINREFYEFHCENKDKPELSCHGKCQINKKSENNSQLLKICFEFVFIPAEVQKEPKKILFLNTGNIISSEGDFALREMFYPVPEAPPNS